jgi:DNA-binding transcriptional ArsR family regulator
METRRDVFQGIADPTRREIIGLIARKPMNLNAIADKFDVSRQAISLHVRVLTECGLIQVRKQGRERFCEARLDQLDDVSAWVDKQKKFWSGKLDALEKFLDQDAAASITRKKTRIKTKRK